MLRVLFYIAVTTLVWGCVCYACEQKKINYQLILHLHPKTYLSSHHVFELGLFLLIVFLSAFMVVIISESYDSQSKQQYFTLYSLMVGLTLIFINPLNIFYRSTRLYILVRIGRTLISPFSVATIQETFVANFLSSLSRMIYDFAYISCIYTRYPPSIFPLPHPADVDPMTAGLNLQAMRACSRFIFRHFMWVRLVPSFCRMWQCVRSIYVTGTTYPFLANAIKYLLTCIVYVMSWITLLYSHHQTDWIFIIWWVLASLKSVYSMYWDLVMDWQIPCMFRYCWV